MRHLGGTFEVQITETEAYLGEGDPASHSHRGPTPRSAIMFGRPGVAYVYLIYGMHFCLNAVTEPAGTGAAVLIRSARPVPGASPPRGRIEGPGRLTRALGIDLAMNGWDLATSDLQVLDAAGVKDADVVVGPRVGIQKATDLALRFRIPGAAVR